MRHGRAAAAAATDRRLSAAHESGFVLAVSRLDRRHHPCHRRRRRPVRRQGCSLAAPASRCRAMDRSLGTDVATWAREATCLRTLHWAWCWSQRLWLSSASGTGRRTDGWRRRAQPAAYVARGRAFDRSLSVSGSLSSTGRRLGGWRRRAQPAACAVCGRAFDRSLSVSGSLRHWSASSAGRGSIRRKVCLRCHRGCGWLQGTS